MNGKNARKHDLDNHSRQLDRQNAEYHRSRGHAPEESERLAEAERQSSAASSTDAADKQ